MTPAAIAAAFGVPESVIASLPDDCIAVLARVVRRRGWLHDDNPAPAQEGTP